VTGFIYSWPGEASGHGHCMMGEVQCDWFHILTGVRQGCAVAFFLVPIDCILGACVCACDC